MHSAAAKLHLDRLRKWRLSVPKNLTISAGVQRIAQDARRADRGLIKATEAWEETAPPEIAESCRPVALRSGTLEIACDSSAAAYSVNHWFQSEGAGALARRGVPVLRLRFVAGPVRNRVQPDRHENGKKTRAKSPRDR
ncbi:MAG: DUF721 domain-containing protein [Phycisphaeraceae bacterium]|nr:DUF721 domain-containing protein [Phycisphaeraceae bacterium]